MLKALLLAGTLLLAAAAQAADFDRTLHVGSAPDLYVSTNSGRVHIYPGPDSEVHVRAHLYRNGYGGGDVDQRIREIADHPPIEQSGNSIHIGDVPPDQRSLFNNITVDYEIAAPRTVAMNLRSGSGDVEVDNVGRFLKAQTGSGSVRAHGIAGACDLHTGSGDIELQQAGQGDVRASTGSGSVRISGLAGGLTAQTGSGDIEAGGHLLGAAHVQSGSGSIRLHIGGDARFNLDASTGSGTIRVPGSYNSEDHHLSLPVNGGGPLLEAKTGSGDIEVN